MKKKCKYNKNFYIDIERKCPVPPSDDKTKVEEYLSKIFNSTKFEKIIKKKYGNIVYEWSKEYIKKTNYHPFRHEYGLYAIVKTLEDLSFK